jgi:hypothetical protein
VSVFSVCMARAALAAALASGATYAGMTIAAPSPAPVAANSSGCPAITQQITFPVTPVQCSYYTDLKDAGLPIVSNAIPNIGNFCSQIKTLGPSQAAVNLSNAWKGSQTPLTVSQAQQYASIAQKDVCP